MAERLFSGRFNCSQNMIRLPRNPLDIWGFKDADIKFIPSFFWNIMSNNVTVYIFIFFNSLASIVSVRVMYDLVCDNCQNWESQKSINAAEIHMFDVDFYFEPTHILCPYFYCWCYCLDGPRQHPRKTHRQKDPQGAQTIISLPPPKKKMWRYKMRCKNV